jgi:hypothetical protein
LICIGVDLGKVKDHTAIAIVVRQETRIFNRFSGQTSGTKQYEPAELRHLERVKLGTPYVEVVQRVARVARHEAMAGVRKVMAVDATGVGTPVVEMLRAALLTDQTTPMPCELKPVVITGGYGERHASGAWYVGKAELVTRLRASLELRDLRIAAGLPETPALVKELTGFGGRGHDDMVMALALAMWGARWHTVPMPAITAPV